MGTTQSSIARIEGGGSLPTLDMLSRLAHATGSALRLAAPGVGDIRPRRGRLSKRRSPSRRCTDPLLPAGLQLRRTTALVVRTLGEAADHIAVGTK